jgi:glycosyltransferase involved in cell wall biosynthesis
MSPSLSPWTIAGDPSTVQSAATRSRNPKVSVVIPALNEAESLPFVLERIPPEVHEVLLVDGRSSDGTIDIARRSFEDICIVMQPGDGKGDALRAGFAAATGDVIVALDADGSTDPTEIPAFVGALCAGADFAKGSRFLQGGGTSDMPIHRKVGNRAFVILVRMLVGGQYSDLCYGYNAFWRDVLPKIDLEGDGFEIEALMNIRALKAGLRVVEVASFESRRLKGVAKLRTVPDGWRVLRTIVLEGAGWGESRRAERAGMRARATSRFGRSD